MNARPTAVLVQKTVERSASVRLRRCTSAAPSATSEKTGTTAAKTITIAAIP